ncbi:BOLA class I histocompatibility antigen, alpha chain BL3-6 [Ictalurus punctatus]|uniref:BOLA class I histocompatibility antigen, alpha chain BL3-6 n=1 Tax=Ictalurus punctatus TaxID=7998 RepID=A0A9F7QZM3_ICTPU|nr:BOLA class I histocompatibility antigen, alpha chain BL3-6 [Ictalurus punctatus]
MEGSCTDSRVGMKVWLFLTFSVHVSSAGTHSLQYCYTAVTPGINFPEFTEVGILDGKQIEYYDSIKMKKISKTEWIEKINADVTNYWNSETQRAQGTQETFKTNMAIAMQRFNQTTGVHTVQLMYGCECDDEMTTRGYFQYGYDGEDFISFDMKAKTWTATNDEAVITKHKWDPNNGYNDYWKNYLEKECIDWLKKYVSYDRETLKSKVRPEASVFQKHSPFPELVCHATGFFPKTVNITWQKDGEELFEDVELRETVPNQDGTFQKRSILTVSAEDLQKHTYTCVIQHSSLEKEIVLREEDIQILNPDGGSDGAPIVIMVAVVVALVVLLAVVAGIVVWKKKNSGFKPVPPKPASEGDSSTNNS